MRCSGREIWQRPGRGGTRSAVRCLRSGPGPDPGRRIDPRTSEVRCRRRRGTGWPPRCDLAMATESRPKPPRRGRPRALTPSTCTSLVGLAGFEPATSASRTPKVSLSTGCSLGITCPDLGGRAWRHTQKQGVTVARSRQNLDRIDRKSQVRMELLAPFRVRHSDRRQDCDPTNQGPLAVGLGGGDSNPFRSVS